MTITRRIKFSVAILLVLMAVLGGIGLSAVIWMKSWSTGYTDAAEQVSTAATIAGSSASMVAFGMSQATATDENTRARFQALWLSDQAKVTEALNSLGSLEDEDAEDSAALAEMTGVFNGVSTGLANAVRLAKTDQQAALEELNGNVLLQALALGEAASAYLQNEQLQQQAALDTLNSRVQFLIIGMAVVLGFGIVVGGILALRASRKISKQLGHAVSTVSGSAAELLAVASQVAASAAQTASATAETTATVEEVRQTAQLAEEKASQVAESSQNVAEGAEKGKTSTDDNIAAFADIADQMSVVAEAINRLNEQTQAVGDIITTVNDLAEQSNLLSVNASIEAAKAGEQGKGFTVVAQEVKSLAEQSKQAVAQVRSILSDIQKASGVAVQAADKGRHSVETGRRQVEDARETTLVLAEDAGAAAQSAVQISASSRQQLAGMEQISNAIESINQAGVQSAAGTRQVEDEVSKLQEIALGLKRLVDAKATA